jgi:hypothetical protein
MAITRRRFKHRQTLEERLADDIAQLRDQAKNMKVGVALDQVLRRIRESEMASRRSELLSSPGLQVSK